MPKIALARVAMDDRSELLPMTICAVLVLAGGIGASILSAINITPPYADILLIAALFVAVIPIFPIAVWLGAKRLSARWNNEGGAPRSGDLAAAHATEGPGAG